MGPVLSVRLKGANGHTLRNVGMFGNGGEDVTKGEGLKMKEITGGEVLFDVRIERDKFELLKETVDQDTVSLRDDVILVEVAEDKYLSFTVEDKR